MAYCTSTTPILQRGFYRSFQRSKKNWLLKGMQLANGGASLHGPGRLHWHPGACTQHLQPEKAWWPGTALSCCLCGCAKASGGVRLAPSSLTAWVWPGELGESPGQGGHLLAAPSSLPCTEVWIATILDREYLENSNIKLARWSPTISKED